MQSQDQNKALKSSFSREATNKHDILMIKKSKRVVYQRWPRQIWPPQIWNQSWKKCKDKLFPQTGFFVCILDDYTRDYVWIYGKFYQNHVIFIWNVIPLKCRCQGKIDINCYFLFFTSSYESLICLFTERDTEVCID